MSEHTYVVTITLNHETFDERQVTEDLRAITELVVGALDGHEDCDPNACPVATWTCARAQDLTTLLEKLTKDANDRFNDPKWPGDAGVARGQASAFGMVNEWLRERRGPHWAERTLT